MKNSLKIAISGVLTALSVILLYIGSIIWLFAYIMPLAAGLIMIIVTDFADKKLALVVYFSVSIISIAMLSDKECALLYALFFGYYPIIKPSLDKILNRFVKWILKFAIFNFAVVSAEMICIYIFMIPFDNEFGKAGIALLIILANIIFVVYEKLFGGVRIIYEKKLKSKIDKYLK